MGEISEQEFLIETSRRCFRFARLCADPEAAAELGRIGSALLKRAHQESSLTHTGCTDDNGNALENVCANCTRDCPY